MNAEELRQHIRRLADSHCRAKHLDIYDSLIRVGPGSAAGFGPPYDACLAEVETNYYAKLGKAQGRELSPAEAVEARKKHGFSPTD